jgi:hypothetical protein
MRAVIQHDLWAVFDWAASSVDFPDERRELEARLAKAIRLLALEPDEIRALPDNYAATVAAEPAPNLPPDLFRSDGPWVCLSAFSRKPTSIVHFSGRSRFLIFMRVPGGRAATLSYLEKLRFSPEPALLKDGDMTQLNLALAQFPVGTQVSLVRQMIAIDTRGKLTPTALTESVQVRNYHAITPGPSAINYINGPASRDEDYFEFRLNRPAVFSQGAFRLVAVNPGEKEFATFSTHGDDPYETSYPTRPGVILARCRSCHVDSGIHSVQSRTQWLHSSPSGDPVSFETRVTMERKEREKNFGLLQALWQKAPE